MGEGLIGITPLPGVDYPINVKYCGNCTMPIEVSFYTIKLNLAYFLYIFNCSL